LCLYSSCVLQVLFFQFSLMHCAWHPFYEMYVYAHPEVRVKHSLQWKFWKITHSKTEEYCCTYHNSVKLIIGLTCYDKLDCYTGIQHRISLFRICLKIHTLILLPLSIHIIIKKSKLHNWFQSIIYICLM
jgi:hypothetical protein